MRILLSILAVAGCSTELTRESSVGVWLDPSIVGESSSGSCEDYGDFCVFAFTSDPVALRVVPDDRSEAILIYQSGEVSLPVAANNRTGGALRSLREKYLPKNYQVGEYEVIDLGVRCRIDDTDKLAVRPDGYLFSSVGSGVVLEGIFFIDLALSDAEKSNLLDLYSRVARDRVLQEGCK